MCIKNILSTAMQILVWGIIQIILLLFFWEMLGNSFFELFCYFAIPTIAAIMLCSFAHRRNFKFQKGKIFTKNSVARVLGRLGVIFLFLAIEYVLEYFGANDLLANNTSAEKIPYIIFNFNVSIVVSFFPLAYAVVEFLFVNIDEK